MTEEQTIGIKLTLNSSEAMKNFQLVSKEVDEMRKNILLLAKDSNKSFADAAKSMTSSLDAQMKAQQKVIIGLRTEIVKLKEDMSQVKGFGGKDGGAKQLKALQIELEKARIKFSEMGAESSKVNAAIVANTTSVKEAEKELTRVYKEEQKLRLQGEKEFTTATLELSKERLASLRESEKQRRETERKGGGTDEERLQIAKKHAEQSKAISKSATEAYKQSIQERINAAKKLKEVGTAQAQQELDSAKITEKAAKQKSQAYKQIANDAQREMKKVESATKRSTTGFSVFGRELGKMGDIAKYVFGTILGVTVITALRSIVRYLGEAAQASIDFARQVYLLEVAIRAYQRSGFDTTIEEWKNLIIELKEQFPIFSEREIVTAVSKAILKLREYNFTQEEIIKTLKISAVLARALGRDFGEMADQITGSLSRGYYEALQNMGVPLNRIAVIQEAWNQGLKESFQQLTEAERAHLGYQLMVRYTADITDDLGKITEESFDKIMVANADLVDAQIELGNAFESSWVFLKEIWAGIIEGIADIITWFAILNRQFTLSISEMELAWQSFLEGFGIKPSEDHTANMKKTIQDMKNEIKELEEQQRSYLGEAEVGIPEVDTSKITRATEDIYNDLEMMQLKHHQKKEQAEVDHTRRIRDINIKHFQRLKDIQDEGQEDVDKRDRDYADKTADILARYHMQVAKALRQFAIRKAEIQRQYRLKERQAERDFQEDMRRLREEFLFDLEDALRERDALQVIRLSRRYTLEKDQAQRQFDLDKQDRKEAYQEELKQLEIQKAERLRSLAEELQIRLAAIAAEKQAEIDLEDEAAKTKAEAEDQRWADDLAAEALRNADKLTDLDTRLGEELTVYATNLSNQYNTTQEWLGKIAKEWKDRYGEDGEIFGYLQNLLSMIQTANEAIAGVEVGEGERERPSLGELSEAQRVEAGRYAQQTTIEDLIGDAERNKALADYYRKQLEEKIYAPLGQRPQLKDLEPFELQMTTREERDFLIATDEDRAKIEATLAEIEQMDIDFWDRHNTRLDEQEEQAISPISDEEVIATEEALATKEQVEIDHWARHHENAETETTTDLEAETDWLQDKVDLFDEYIPQIEEKTLSLLEIIIAFVEEMWGENSPLVKAFKAYAKSLKNLIEITMQARMIIASMMGSLGGGGGGDRGSKPKFFAEGGSMLAMTPTTAVFGEKEPEFVEFTPISKLGSKGLGKMFGGGIADLQGNLDINMNKQDRLALEMLLSPDLEARITENTLGEAAEIIMSTTSSRRH